ncbi:MAG: diguanylate cyclase [Burkholderiales bacterium]
MNTSSFDRPTRRRACEASPTPARFLRWCRTRLGLLACILPAFAAHAQQRSFQYYDQTDGLRNLAVTTLVQDRAGYLWVGTENGLYRYDGSTFRRFGAEQGLGTRLIRALHADARGGLWVGSDQGLFRRHDESFVEVLMAGAHLPVGPGQSLDSAAAPEQVLVVSDRRLLQVAPAASGGDWVAQPFFSDAQMAGRPELRRINGVHAARDGSVWLGCSASLCRVDDKQVDAWRLPGGDERGAPLGILQDSRGDLWLNNASRQLVLPRGQREFIDRTDARAHRGSVHVYTPVVEDASGRILTRNSDDGVSRWDGHRWEVVGAAQGLSAGGGVNAILVDAEGGVWLGTAGHGLARWAGYRHFSAWTTRDGLPHDEVWSFGRDAAGRLRIGSGMGVVELDEAQRRMVGPAREGKGADTHQAGTMARDKAGDLWIGTFSGALLRVAAHTNMETLVATLPLIYRVFVDSGGRLWICTQRGIFLIDLPAGERTPRRVDDKVNADPSIGPISTDVCERSPGELWITTDRGLLRWKDSQLGRVTPQALDGSTPASSAFSVIACAADGTVWLAGGAKAGGLWQLRATAQGFTLNEHEQASRSLSDREVVSLRQDRRGWLWAGTDDGVVVWSGAHSRHLNQEAGLVWNDCNQGALYEDDDGSIWVGTSRGVAHIEQPETLFDVPPLRVRIDAVSRDGQPVRSAPGESLPWARGALTISTVSASYEGRRSLRFLHRMLGVDERWLSAIGGDVSYPSLAPGHYRFEAMVQNDDLQNQSPTVAFEFDIKPPWWRSDVFYAACALAFGLAAVSLYRWRLRALSVEQQRLEHLVQMRTRELEASREQMRELASRDGLTGLWNRRALVDILQTELARAPREGRPLAVVIADADHFKEINDSHGHLAGDRVLKEIAARLVASTRAYDCVGRYGGEEFILVLPGLHADRAEDRARIEAFHHAIGAESFNLGDGLEVSVTCSFGVVSASTGATVEEVIARADAALYRAKERGRNRIEYG